MEVTGFNEMLKCGSKFSCGLNVIPDFILFAMVSTAINMNADCTCVCVMCAAAGLISTQHGSGEDAEAGASEADPQ